MRVKLQLVICDDEGHEETVTDVITLHKNHKRIEHLGLSLAESKQLLGTLQRQILQQQVTTFLDTHSTCPDCGTTLDLKARGSKSFRTLFGTFQFYSPRLKHCDCKRRKMASFRPLSALLTEPVAPELLYMESKWSSLVSYGLSLDALQDFLPIDLSLDVKTVRHESREMPGQIANSGKICSHPGPFTAGKRTLLGQLDDTLTSCSDVGNGKVGRDSVRAMQTADIFCSDSLGERGLPGQQPTNLYALIKHAPRFFPASPCSPPPTCFPASNKP